MWVTETVAGIGAEKERERETETETGAQTETEMEIEAVRRMEKERRRALLSLVDRVRRGEQELQRLVPRELSVTPDTAEVGSQTPHKCSRKHSPVAVATSLTHAHFPFLPAALPLPLQALPHRPLLPMHTAQLSQDWHPGGTSDPTWLRRLVLRLRPLPVVLRMSPPCFG